MAQYLRVSLSDAVSSWVPGAPGQQYGNEDARSPLWLLTFVTLLECVWTSVMAPQFWGMYPQFVAIPISAGVLTTALVATVMNRNQGRVHKLRMAVLGVVLILFVVRTVILGMVLARFVVLEEFAVDLPRDTYRSHLEEGLLSSRLTTVVVLDFLIFGGAQAMDLVVCFRNAKHGATYFDDVHKSLSPLSVLSWIILGEAFILQALVPTVRFFGIVGVFVLAIGLIGLLAHRFRSGRLLRSFLWISSVYTFIWLVMVAGVIFASTAFCDDCAQTANGAGAIGAVIICLHAFLLWRIKKASRESNRMIKPSKDAVDSESIHLSECRARQTPVPTTEASSHSSSHSISLSSSTVNRGGGPTTTDVRSEEI